MASEGSINQQVHSFTWNHHRQIFFNTIFNLKKEEVFCDVTLACDGFLFPAHRLVLAMCSEFFNEILTKVPNQQSMLVLVPTVSAEDLDALLTYIYRGEIQVSQADLPSIMKAAQFLKIKGFCSTNANETPWQQYMRCPESETSNMESRENDSRDSVFSVPPDYDQEVTQNATHLPQLHPIASKLPQVEVIINDLEVTPDMIYEEERDEQKPEVNDEINKVWTRVLREDGKEEDEEELDPLSVPLLPSYPLTFSSPNHNPDTPDPSEMVVADYSHQEQDLVIPITAAMASTSSCFRYTNEQKLQIVKNYYHYGPTRTARLMSNLLGRKMNESSVRSIARSWIRNQKAKDQEKQQT